MTEAKNKTGRPPKPTLPAAHPIGKRLEEVRGVRGFETLRDFWRSLREAGSRISYEAVKKYHYDREPPVSYLEAVSQLTDFRVEWLATGREPRTYAGEVAARQGDEGPAGSFFRGVEAGRVRAGQDLAITWGQYGPLVFGTLESLLAELLAGGEKPLDSYSEEQVSEGFFLLAWLLTLPERAIGANDFLSEGRGREYILAMAAAIQIAMPRPGRGYPLAALAGLRAAFNVWEARLPRAVSEGEVAEQMRKRPPAK